MQKNVAVSDSRVEEYGAGFDNKCIEAFSLKSDDDYIVLVRQSKPLKQWSIHELRHELTGDL